MFNRISVNAILKSAIGMLAAGLILVLALGAWDSWSRLAVANRIAHVADASAYLFTGIHNLRLDRSTSVRQMVGDAQDGIKPDLRGFREAEIPALKAGLKVDAFASLGAPPQHLAYPRSRMPEAWAKLACAAPIGGEPRRTETMSPSRAKESRPLRRHFAAEMDSRAPVLRRPAEPDAVDRRGLDQHRPPRPEQVVDHRERVVRRI